MKLLLLLIDSIVSPFNKAQKGYEHFIIAIVAICVLIPFIEFLWLPLIIVGACKGISCIYNLCQEASTKEERSEKLWDIAEILFAASPVIIALMLIAYMSWKY